MVKRTTPIRVICFFLLAECAALCQGLPSSEWKSLPNAPSPIQLPTRAEEFHTSAFNSAGVLRGTEYSGMQPGLTAFYQTAFIEKKLSYAPSNNSSFIGRASYAASNMFIERDGSGKGRLNSSYFIEMLTSVAAHAAYRPSRERSTSTTFNNVGSTIGSAAGINVYHEFEPGIRQMAARLTPKLVTQMHEQTIHGDIPRSAAPISAR